MNNECQTKRRSNLAILIATLQCLLGSLAIAGPVDLSTWSVVQFQGADDGNAVWTFSKRGTIATQSANSDPSVLLGSFDVSNCRIRGTFAGGNTDNDYIGFVFGYQGRGQFYLFDWKQQDQSHGLGMSEKGMRVRKLSVPDGGDPVGSDFWKTSGTANMEILRHNGLVWEYPNEYEFVLDFVPGQFEITVSEADGILEHWVITDNTYMHGRFGFFNFSQPMSAYKLMDMNCSSQIIYVDDDAPNDPVPNDLTISDPGEDGTREHPFDMIQEGIDAVRDGGTVVVLSGTYWEAINFRGKSIKVTSFEPNVPNDQRQPYPVIDGNGQGPVVTFNQGEDSSTELSGFTITRGLHDAVSAVLCFGSHPMISNCLIVGNRTSGHYFGAAVYCLDSYSVIENCTIADNYGGQYGASIYSVDSGIGIRNSIVWGNTPEQIMVETESGSDPIIAYSDVMGGWPGPGNISEDPSFAANGYWVDPNDPNLHVDPNHPHAFWIDGDYHLQWPSPCIDAGDPEYLPSQDEYDCDGEPRVSYDRIDMGYDEYLAVDAALDIGSTIGGTVRVPGEGISRYEFGTLVGVEATADTCYRFVDWTGTAVEANKVTDVDAASTTVLADANYSTLIAHFALNRYRLTVSSGDGGSVTEPNGTFTYDCNESVPIVATPDPKHHFVNWTGTAVDAGKVVDPNGTNTTVTVDGDYGLQANFAPDDIIKCRLTISSTDGGSVTEPGAGLFTCEYNSVVPIVAEPNLCFEFITWTGTAVDESKVKDPSNPETEVLVDGDYTLFAEFALENLPIIPPSEGGYVVVDKMIDWYECEKWFFFEAIAEPCYEFSHWTGSVVDELKVPDPTLSAIDFVADMKYTLKAHFKPTMIEDDFELYNDIDPNKPGSNRIFEAWADGYGDDTNGAVVGYDPPKPSYKPSYTETTIVHGGGQSMPYSYDNDMKISEATKTLDCPRDWTEADVTTLSLWFQGDPTNAAEPMFVALNGNAVVYHDDPAATQIAGWTEWTIDLQAFADQGVDLTNVNTITIGFGTKGAPTAGGTGKVYFDDIRLLRPAEQPQP